jgi:hypothetical protein
VATDYVVVAATDGKGNLHSHADHSGEARHDHLRGTSEPIASCASGAGNALCQQPDGSLVATAEQKIQFGILGSDGRSTVQKMSAFEEILRNYCALSEELKCLVSRDWHHLDGGIF